MRISDWSSDVCYSDLTEGLKMDETVRHTSIEQMAKLEPLTPGGTITAGVSSQTGDAASAMLIVSEKALKQYGLKARARIHHMSVYSDDPIFMLTAPIPATKRALQKSGLKLEDIDLVDRKSTRLNSSHSCATRMPY